MFRGIIIDILIALVVILLRAVLFAFSPPRPPYLLDEAQEALHGLSARWQPPTSRRAARARGSSQHRRNATTFHHLVPLKTLISARAAKRIVSPSFKQNNKKVRGRLYKIYGLEYPNVKIDKGEKRWRERRTEGCEQLLNRAKLERAACQAEEPAPGARCPLSPSFEAGLGGGERCESADWTISTGEAGFPPSATSVLVFTQAWAEGSVWFRFALRTGNARLHSWHRTHRENNQQSGLTHTHSPLSGKRVPSVLIGAAGRRLGSC